MQLYSSKKKKSQATTHVSESNPSRASSSALASSSFALSFSLASTGNQSCIKFMSAQSTFAIQWRAGKRKRPRAKKQKQKLASSQSPKTYISNNSHRFATTTDGALHIGHSSCPLFCIFTKHLTQNKWPQSNLIGLNAIFIQIKHT